MRYLKGFYKFFIIASLVFALLPRYVASAETDKATVYRLYNYDSKSYLYTTDKNEVDTLKAFNSWRSDGVVWYAPLSGTPVYRLRNNGGIQHYTSDETEINNLIKLYGWAMDNGGVPMFYSGGSTNIFRLYNPVSGFHYFTPDIAEYNLMAAGEWEGEAESFFAESVPEKTDNGITVCIDPGHQLHGDSKQEPNGPGSSVMKARVTQGTTGRTTGTPEYKMNLEVGLMLRDELIARGYNVVMTRETHDVNISNKERAEFATAQNADITIRIHGNGSDNTSIKGALTMVPSSNNPYVANIAAESNRLGKDVIDAYCAATGMTNKGVMATDTMTGINYCTMPVCIIEMGFMSNPDDDRNMQDAAFRVKMVEGMANGIDKYFDF